MFSSPIAHGGGGGYKVQRGPGAGPKLDKVLSLLLFESLGMAFRVVELRETELAEYGKIPIAFRVESRFRAEGTDGGPGGLAFTEEALTPFVKDYDAIPGEGPVAWVKRWDISSWGIFGAYDGSRLIGGAAVAWKTQGLDMLQSRVDRAVLWDIRVHPEYRRKGVGGALFRHATAWATQRGCTMLVVETQDINVPACRFYARHGCELAAINAHAYANLPGEAQLLWHKSLLGL